MTDEQAFEEVLNLNCYISNIKDMYQEEKNKIHANCCEIRAYHKVICYLMNCRAEITNEHSKYFHTKYPNMIENFIKEYALHKEIVTESELKQMRGSNDKNHRRKTIDNY